MAKITWDPKKDRDVSAAEDVFDIYMRHGFVAKAGNKVVK